DLQPAHQEQRERDDVDPLRDAYEERVTPIEVAAHRRSHCARSYSARPLGDRCAQFHAFWHTKIVESLSTIPQARSIAEQRLATSTPETTHGKFQPYGR